ncbi:putative GNAT family N-acetyltransferase [Cladophialophora carrionii]|uniref:Putative GNAT family N-acetyltransferase n=1 Tax=Cladophialophora carrionii TaxID=86049 RepID=A0A1C1D0Q2_9EURO|nr:putative GNAT family N-acetyltransferase [Cladophialophora carrionii]
MEDLNKAFASDTLYWASPLPGPVMRNMLDNCICFGLYSPTPAPPAPAPQDNAISASTAPDPAEILHEIAGHVKPASSSEPTSHRTPAKDVEQHRRQTQDQEQPSLIGFARLITDRVTFAYLTDVYTLPEWQGQGLGKWLISCVQEIVEDMPHLRRSMCIVGHGKEKGIEFYGSLMKMTPLTEPAMVLPRRYTGLTTSSSLGKGLRTPSEYIGSLDGGEKNRLNIGDNGKYVDENRRRDFTPAGFGECLSYG